MFIKNLNFLNPAKPDSNSDRNPLRVGQEIRGTFSQPRTANK